MKKICNIIFIIITIFLMLYIGYQKIYLKKEYIEIFGFSSYIVKTGSMLPEIDIGNYILVKKSKDYNINDIITYKEKNILVTHRIIRIEKNKYITKGDYNNHEDNPIIKEDIIGKVILNSKFLGFGITYLFKPLLIILIVICILKWR